MKSGLAPFANWVLRHHRALEVEAAEHGRLWEATLGYNLFKASLSSIRRLSKKAGGLEVTAA